MLEQLWSITCLFLMKISVFISQFYLCGFPNDNPQRVRRFSVGRTRFMIISLTAHFTRIAVGDCRDGVVFYSYHEVTKSCCCFLSVILLFILLISCLLCFFNGLSLFNQLD